MRRIIYIFAIVFCMTISNINYAMTLASAPVKKEAVSRIENSIIKFRENMKESDEIIDFTEITKPNNVDVFLTNVYSNSFFELVSPTINSNSDVAHESELLISIKLLEKIEAYLDVVKLENPRSMAYSSVSNKKLERIYSLAPIDVEVNLTKKEIKHMDPLVEVDFSDIENLDKYDELTLLYEKSSKSMVLAYDSYENVLKKELANKNNKPEVIKNMIKKRQLLVNGFVELYESRKLYEAAARSYAYVKEKYEGYNSEIVLDSIPIVKNGVLPYFNTILKDASLGKYQIIVRDKDGKILGEIIEFYIVDEKTLTQNLYNIVKKQVSDIAIPKK